MAIPPVLLNRFFIWPWSVLSVIVLCLTSSMSLISTDKPSLFAAYSPPYFSPHIKPEWFQIGSSLLLCRTMISLRLGIMLYFLFLAPQHTKPSQALTCLVITYSRQVWNEFLLRYGRSEDTQRCLHSTNIAPDSLSVRQCPALWHISERKTDIDPDLLTPVSWWKHHTNT